MNQERFLAAFASTANVSAAAKLSSIGRATHYTWLRDRRYAEAFAEAADEAADRLETEARRRAVAGVAEPVYYKGERVGSIQQYSDTLLIVLLRAARPEKYAHFRGVSGKGTRGAIPLEDVVADGREGEGRP